jgi:hypothetical protein
VTFLLPSPNTVSVEVQPPAASSNVESNDMRAETTYTDPTASITTLRRPLWGFYGGLIQTNAALETMMLDHSTSEYYIGNNVTSSGFSNDGTPITLSEAYTKFPGESGDVRTSWTPSGTTTTTSQSGTVGVSAEYGGFGFSYNFNVGTNSTLSPVFPSGPSSSEPAFGSEWQGSNHSSSSNTVYEAADSGDVIHLASGQSTEPTLYAVCGHG